jgi:hypothetical protein
MNPPTLLRTITAIATVIAAVGCREINDVRHAGPAGAPRAQTPLHLEDHSPKFGMNGYQPGLDSSRTGDGRMNTAGLPARGGGPAATAPSVDTSDPTSLAPDQHIGSSTNRVRDIFVVTDPTSRAVKKLP